jgi:hypothetical protein
MARSLTIAFVKSLVDKGLMASSQSNLYSETTIKNNR